MMAQSIRKNLRVILSAFEVTLRTNIVDAFVLFTILLQPLVIAVLAMWMLSGRDTSNAIYAVVGSGMTGFGDYGESGGGGDRRPRDRSSS